MREEMTQTIELPEGVTSQLNDKVLLIKGPKGEVSRVFHHPKISVKTESGSVVLHAPVGTKREKKIIGSFMAHIKNMVQGVQEPHEYKLKICSGHFPMNVAVSGQEIVIKNFLGEAVPRRVTFSNLATVKVDGTEITVTSLDREIAGQTAGKIESLCRITNRDKRIFQDGCYITKKCGKEIV